MSDGFSRDDHVWYTSPLVKACPLSQILTCQSYTPGRSGNEGSVKHSACNPGFRFRFATDEPKLIDDLSCTVQPHERHHELVHLQLRRLKSDDVKTIEDVNIVTARIRYRPVHKSSSLLLLDSVTFLNGASKRKSWIHTR